MKFIRMNSNPLNRTQWIVFRGIRIFLSESSEFDPAGDRFDTVTYNRVLWSAESGELTLISSDRRWLEKLNELLCSPLNVSVIRLIQSLFSEDSSPKFTHQTETAQILIS